MAGRSGTTTEVLEGPMLDVIAALLAEGRQDEVLEAVRKLLEHNRELQGKLASLDSRSAKRFNEGISRAQLQLFVDRLRQQAEGRPTDEESGGEVRSVVADERLLARAEAAAERARARALSEGSRPKNKPLKKALPEHLPRKENVIDVPPEQRKCPTCGRERHVCDREVAEVLEFEPAKLYVRSDVRLVRCCDHCDEEVMRAPRGDKVVEGGQIGCSVVSQIVYDKYELGVPLNRQCKVFARLGMKFSTSTLCDQVKWGAELLTPLWHEAIEQTLGSAVMHIDGTGLKVLDRNHPDGRRLGTLWATVGADESGPKVAAYFYASTKKGKGQRPQELGPLDILAQRNGITVSDADTLFAAQMKRVDVIDCGCNMHARRYFVKALDGGDERAALVLGAFKELYQIEDDGQLLTADERLALRQEHSTPAYDDIMAWCRHHQPDIPPKSPLGRAIGYMLRHEEALRRFETDGRIPIDNKAAEHSFVPVALTRKNYLFLGHDNGGDRAAIIYTVLHCCRIANVDPVAYLRDVLPILSRGIRRVDVAGLMPAAWATRRVTTA